MSDKFEQASFGIGCFWSETVFGELEGVKRTRVGYAGGEKENPTYTDLGDHTETVQIDYKPEKVSYQELLRVFWGSHNQAVKKKKQYQSTIFYHNKEQKEIASKFLKDKEEQLGPLETELKKLDKFYLAEPYHQKYRLRNSGKYEDFKDLTDKELRESEKAAKINAKVA